MRLCVESFQGEANEELFKKRFVFTKRLAPWRTPDLSDTELDDNSDVDKESDDPFVDIVKPPVEPGFKNTQLAKVFEQKENPERVSSRKPPGSSGAFIAMSFP